MPNYMYFSEHSQKILQSPKIIPSYSLSLQMIITIVLYTQSMLTQTRAIIRQKYKVAQNKKQNKNTRVFSNIKYSKFLSFWLKHSIEPKPLTYLRRVVVLQTSYKQKKQKRGAAVLCQVSICLSVCHAANQLHHIVDEPLDVSPTYMHLLEFGIYNLFWLVNIVLLIMLFLYTENNLCFTCKLYTIKRNKVILLVLFFLVIILESAKSVSFIPI